MKRYLKPKYIVLGLGIIIFCFVPVVDMEYLVVVEKQVLEPYTVLEEVQEPYQSVYEYYDESGADDWSKIFYPERKTMPITRYRTVTEEVTKTRLVTRPVAETQTKRVSILRYLLR